MISFKNFPIKHKLSAIIIAVTAIALGITSVFIIIYDSVNFKQKLYKELVIVADIIGDNNTANLTFNSAEEAEISLSSLKANKNILAACIYDANNKILATYQQEANQNFKFAKIFSYTDGYKPNDGKMLEVYRPIKLKEELIGSVFVASDLKELDQRTRKFILTSFIILLFSLLVSYLITLKIQRVISDPILELAKVEKEISENHDYSIRISDDRKDELGSLTRAFNEMLDQIERQNIELVKAKDVAVQSEKAKESFLANMSHEIRTPLNAILGLSELMNQGKVDVTHKRYLEGITSSGEQLMSIVNDILDFSKIQAGKFTFEKIGFNVSKVVENILNTFTFRLKEKNLFLEFEVEESIPPVIIGDPVRLIQILTNLINNAIKFTNNGSIKVNCKLNKWSAERVIIEFSVTDSGIGIAEDKLDHIFNSFTQADTTTSRVYGGTGLGLAICKNLVELQGGKIGVKSEINKGSQFFFTIPFKEGTPEDLKHNTPEQETHVELDGMHILCVDDYTMNQTLVITMLEKYNITVDVASNGQEGVEKLLKNSYDAILMDIQMPVMDGIQASEKIRTLEDEAKRTVPIIALTANAIKGEEKKFFDAGMDDYLLKPFKIRELVSKLSKYYTPKLTEGEIKTLPSIQKEKEMIPSSNLNITALKDLTGDDEKLIHLMLTQLSKELPEFCSQILDAAETNTLSVVKEVLHKMKPATAYIGLHKTFEQISIVEETIEEKTNWRDDIIEIVTDISNALPLIEQYLKDHPLQD